MADQDQSKKAYFAKYKDPRWQKMRLQIMERDNYTCQVCKSTDKTLNVHHKYYIWGNEPWDYKPEALITLCEDCHQDEEDCKGDMQITVKHLLHEGYSYRNLQIYLMGLLDSQYPDKNRQVELASWCADDPISLERAENHKKAKSDEFFGQIADEFNNERGEQ